MLGVLIYIINLHHKYSFYFFLLKTKYQDSIKKNMLKHEKPKTNINYQLVECVFFIENSTVSYRQQVFLCVLVKVKKMSRNCTTTKD